MSVTVTLPRRVAERARREAEKLGLGLEDYLIELIVQGLDPRDRAIEYIEAAKELVERARKELQKGDVRQAAEKTWGAAALAVKAYAAWRDGKRLTSHKELWEYSKRLAEELGDWAYTCWNQASSMHICFYEGWCQEKHVEVALRQVEQLVKKIAEMIKVDKFIQKDSPCS